MKSLKIIGIAAVTVAMLMAVGCNTNVEPPHEHTYNEEWSSDETNHWHDPSCDDTDKVKDKAKHKWDKGEVTAEPTCAEAGVKTYKCTVCDDVIKTEEVAATGHEWKTEVTKAKTCDTKGEQKLTCKVCNETKTEEIPAGHTYSEEWTSDATHHWHAATCVHTDETKDKAEHDFTVAIENGKKNKKCSVCGYISWTKPVLKGGYNSSSFSNEFKNALTSNFGFNLTKVVFGLLSDSEISAKVATLANKIDIGAVDSTCYAYAEPDGGNMIIYIVPTDENAIGFVFNEDSRYMFNLTDIQEIVGLDLADTSNVTNMSGMFAECYVLTSLDVSGFDTSNVTSMSGMFRSCGVLTSLDVSGFDTSNVTGMSYMFSGCNSLTSLDVSGFDTSNVTDMSCMFTDCSGLTELDLSGFDTSNVTSMNWMFYYCSDLTTIYVEDKDTFIPSGCTTANMFTGCGVSSADGLTNKPE